MTIPVTLEELGSRKAGLGKARHGEGKMHWGIGLGNLTPELRDQLQIPSSTFTAP
jgi:hypothetical protein